MLPRSLPRLKLVTLDGPSLNEATPPLASRELLDAQILIVDDEQAHVQLLEHLLREEGYSCVSSTSDPRQVRALHREKQYDLILLDLQMPGLDGFGVMAALQADNDDSCLPVVVLTAQPGHKLRALAAGARDFISKPFDAIETRTRIHNMLEMRMLYKKLARYNQALEAAVRERTAALAASEERFRRFTELASDWYWEQSESGEFTQVAGPVEQMLGLGLTALLGRGDDNALAGWNESERRTLHGAIESRQPFIDYAFSRVDAAGSTRQFRVSGEPMFDVSGRYVGFRGIGVEVMAAR